MTLTARLVAAAIAIAVVAVGGALVLGPGTGPTVGATASPSTAQPASPPSSPSQAAVASSAPIDYSDIGGRILMEHLGNAPDGSEMPTTDYHPERRRLYWMDPAKMTGATAVEFLPGQPTGKLDADVAKDGSKVVFMDTAVPAQVWIANVDGTGLRKLSDPCTCSELDPAFDPTGTKIVFVHLEGATRNSQNGANLGIQWDQASTPRSWLAIRDIATGNVTKLPITTKDGGEGVPDQPAWSPDGQEIVFSRITWGEANRPVSNLQIVDPVAGTIRTLPTSDSTSGLDASTPGDPDWSPDGSTIVFTNYAFSAMGSIGDLPGSRIFTIGRDGTGLRRLGDGGTASYMPDGRLLFQNNYFWIMNADGTDPRPVKFIGDDLTELNVGFAYVPHWVPNP
jgi:Tol biopolymer transport system component